MGPGTSSLNSPLTTAIRAEPWLLDAVEEALQRHGIAPQDVRACLLFGSRARGDAHSDSDLDLIHVVRGRAAGTGGLDYQRFVFGGTKVDSNAIALRRLNQYCSDPHWAYRLCTARPITARSADPATEILAWLQGIHQMIAAEPACRHRAALQLRDLDRLLSTLSPIYPRLPHVVFYTLAEMADLGPILFLELCGKAPFQTGRPVEQVREAVPLAPPALADAFGALIRSLRDGTRWAMADRQEDLDATLTMVRRQCRRVMEAAWPESFGRGYTFLLDAGPGRMDEIEERLSAAGTPALGRTDPFLDALGRFVRYGQALVEAEPSADSPRRPLPPLSRPATPAGPRFAEYDRARRRAKVILGTGGCRVPGCTFCMLPTLAHAKAPVDDALWRLRAAITGPLEQVALYTDGSFFDDRELTEDERRHVVATVSGWGAAEVLVESLPRFVTAAALAGVRSALQGRCALRIAVGLQSIDAEVRKYVTRTPIAEGELERLLDLRRVHPFSLRVYLLAGKCMMTVDEDLADVERSVDCLNSRLAPSDVVTINPLLPTAGTLVEVLERARYFERMSSCMAAALARRLHARSLTFHLEFGPLDASTCTSSLLSPAPVRWTDGRCGHDRCLDAEDGSFGTGMLPWSLLGPLSVRSRWAASLAPELSQALA